MSDEVTIQLIRERVRESIALKRAMLAERPTVGLATLAEATVASLRRGGKVVLFGNGGSAADATHIAAEFVGRFQFDRDPLPALSLSDNGSSVTAIGNDYGYHLSFARQVLAFGQTGDIAIGLSTSGASENVIEGLRMARDRGLFTAAFTGERGGGLNDLTDVCIVIPSASTARIQEGYMLYAHIMCELVETEIFGTTEPMVELTTAA